MGKYNKSNANNIFKEEPEISVSEHTVTKKGRRLKMVIPEGKIGYGDVESHAQIAGDLATKHSDDTKAGEKAYEQAREHREVHGGSTIEENQVDMAVQKIYSRMPVAKVFYINDPITGKPVAIETLFMKTEPSGIVRPLKYRYDIQTKKTTEVPI